MSDSLIGKASIVTGASRDTSRATAERLANDGAMVVNNYATSVKKRTQRSKQSRLEVARP
jgi:3-oxoacyl-[acyl-carrier protein] reductase